MFSNFAVVAENGTADALGSVGLGDDALSLAGPSIFVDLVLLPASLRACVRACVRVCVRACVRVCVGWVAGAGGRGGIREVCRVWVGWVCGCANYVLRIVSGVV